MSKKVVLSIIETLVINIIIYIIFFKLQPNQDVYLQLNPHPLLILCIVMAIRYGNYLGVLSSTISILFYLGIFTSIYGDISLVITDFDHYKYPLLFLIIASTLGFFKDNKDIVIENLSNDKKQLLREYKKVSRNYRESNKALSELKKQIIDSDESILNLYDIASKLETLDSEEVYTEMVGILSKYLSANQVSIYSYMPNSDFLRLKVYFGERENNSSSLSIKGLSGFKKVIEEKVPVRWAEVKEPGFPLMAAPLIRDNKVLAIICVESMNFDLLSEYAYQLFKLIVEWFNKSLGRAIFVDELKESKYIDGTKLMKYKYFADRLKEEERRRREFGMDFILLIYRVRKLNPDEIDRMIQGLLRSMDVVCYDINTNTLFILLPATSKDKKLLVTRRIENRFNDYLDSLNENDLRVIV